MPEANEKPEPPNEWTLMFFFASDNLLSPSMVSQLKSIKDAGFQSKTTVAVHFDPNEIGVPTRFLNVNEKRKLDAADAKTAGRRSSICTCGDADIRNIVEDSVDPHDIEAQPETASSAMIAGLEEPDKMDAEKALTTFINFCHEQHKAKHYMLFLVGHGMIVGNDAFLPDDNPKTGIPLVKLDGLLRPFADKVRDEGGEFELLALHSCSMSSIEVAYQLKGTAKYMMASEGLSFVGSWPYRRLLMKTFKTIERARTANKPVDVHRLMTRLYSLSFQNAEDYMFAGYSSDLCLCNLQPDKVEALKEPLQRLAGLLKRGLEEEQDAKVKRVTELILLAHWKSQSYWQENYTDLYDFCRCLRESCAARNELQKSIRDACKAVMDGIKVVVVRSENFGSKYQYSHGLSVYFPWSRPVETVNNGSADAKSVLENYRAYAFTQELGQNSWFEFLETYFDKTKRASREEEDAPKKKAQLPESERAAIAEAKAKAHGSFNAIGWLSGSMPYTSLAGPGDGKPIPSMGLGCSCPSIKNFPEEDRKDQGTTRRNLRAFAMSEGALKLFMKS